ncbi:MAG: hypothetical protein JSW66_08865 [Phycisphaerales bacterium]|nr:MAG: hypothetical protein JSW66_08865 [Phycisphaerales bacterium]
MVDKIENNPPLIETSPPSGQANQPRALPKSGDDVSIQVDYASLIEEAMQPPDDDALRVAEGRDLLLSGELESPQSIRETAEILVNRGA